MCGIFGIANHSDASRMAHLGLYALQHRGQESTGISSSDGDQVFTHKSMGYVADVFSEDVLKRLKGRNAIGHTRYSTAGDSSEGNAQPIVVKSIRNYGTVALVHNGNLINAFSLRERLERQGAIFQSTSDSEVILHLLARSEADNLLDALAETLAQVQGAFCLLLLTQDSLIAVRDPNGFRPLNLGKVDGSYVLASETCAFDLIGATYIREVEPGEIVLMRGDDLQSVKALHAPRLAKCIFEHVYFSRPDSVVFGRTVQTSRDLMGHILAQESPVDADLVVPIPDSGVAAAIGYSQESRIPFAFGLIRNHYVGRTFIEPKTKIRHFGVKVKLNPVKELLTGKRVVLIDDSIVRGTTSRKIVKMVRAAGAKEVHVRISCPPTLSPCFYGIDTPTKKELIASSHTVEEIAKYIEADSLAYLSLPGLIRAVAGKGSEFCTACYTGQYPIDFVDMTADDKAEDRQLDLWEASLKET
ncbi:MAG: amidophosphoribosyltransferase [Acidobacteria bacterium]|nr:MAG: amidophosphoribosyltransferase [Acidobacteriota bacterium]